MESVSAAFADNYLDGEQGRFAQVWNDTIYGHGLSREEDRDFKIFHCADILAHANHSHEGSRPVPEAVLKRDLETLLKNITRGGLVLLFDECDVLQRNQPILQQIRNVFMQSKGCMLGIAATPSFFPELRDTLLSDSAAVQGDPSRPVRQPRCSRFVHLSGSSRLQTILDSMSMNRDG